MRAWIKGHWSWPSFWIGFAVVMLLSAIARGQQQDNTVTLQPDETFPWWCEFTSDMDHIVSSATAVVVIKGGPDASPSNLISSLQIDGNNTKRALWYWTPLNRPKNTTYSVHILVEDAFGSRFACDGTVRVEKAKL